MAAYKNTFSSIAEESIEFWVTDEDVKESPFHRERLEDGYNDLMESGELGIIVQIMRFGLMRRWGDNDDTLSKITFELIKLTNALDNGTKIHPQSFFGETVKDKNGHDVAGYFKGTANEFALYEWSDDGSEIVPLLNTELVRMWRLMASTITQMLYNLATDTGGE